MFGGAIKFGDCQMKYAILRNCSFVSDRRDARISQMRRPKILFDPIYDPDRLTGFFKLSAEKNGLVRRVLKRIQKQITDHPMRRPVLGR